MSNRIDYTNVNLACPYCFYSGKQYGCETCTAKRDESSFFNLTKGIKKLLN